jgi:hypothetical protein
MAATKAVSPGPGATSSGGAVKLFLTSVVREKLGSFSGDCTLRSVGARGRVTAPGDPVLGVKFPGATQA